MEGEFAAKTPPRPDNEGFVEGRDGTRIFYETFGDRNGQAMVLSDGIVCNGTFFWYLIRYFRKSFRILRWAYRGHGLSEAPRDMDRLGIEDCVDDLWSVMDSNGIESAVHLGYSMGVQVLLEAEHRHPERFDALILMSGAPGKPLDTFHGNTFARSALPLLYSLVLDRKSEMTMLWQSLVPTNLVYLVATLTELDGRLIDRDLLMPYFEHLSRMDLELFLSMLSRAAEHDAKPYMGAVASPTLVIGGTNDNFTPFYLAEEMYEAIPDAELLRVEGGSHSAPIEQPDLINLKIEDFLYRNGYLVGYHSS